MVHRRIRFRRDATVQKWIAADTVLSLYVYRKV
nr:MAG TPA: hypothetical protein [Caudoviricetes sp.]